jgi:hypothetical protein
VALFKPSRKWFVGLTNLHQKFGSAPLYPIDVPTPRQLGRVVFQKEQSQTMSAASPVPAAPFLTDSYVFDWKAQSFRADSIFVLPMAICLVVGIWLGQPAAGMIAAGGAFTVGFGAKQHIGESSLLPMILASLGISAATFVGMVAGHTNFLLVLLERMRPPGEKNVPPAR